MIDNEPPTSGGAGEATAAIVRVEAKPGREDDLEKLLHDLHADLPADGCWWSLRLGSGEHAVFTTAPELDLSLFDEHAALLDGEVGVEPVEVLARKLAPQRIVTKALLLRLPVRASAVVEATARLEAATRTVDRELETVAWFGLRFGDGDLGVVAGFPDRHARRSHLTERFAREVGRDVFGMLDAMPSVELADVVDQRRPRR